MCHSNEMYCETCLSGQTNRQAVISLKTFSQDYILEKMGYNMK